MNRRGWVAAGLLMGVVLGGCATMSETSAPAKPSLYKRLGGRENIAQVVDTFVANMVADERVNARLKTLPPPAMFKFRTHLADQICEATGGPCSYVGGDMKAVHKGMNISDAQWNATVENLTKALDKQKVGAQEKQELLATIGPLKTSIVGQ